MTELVCNSFLRNIANLPKLGNITAPSMTPLEKKKHAPCFKTVGLAFKSRIERGEINDK